MYQGGPIQYGSPAIIMNGGKQYSNVMIVLCEVANT